MIFASIFPVKTNSALKRVIPSKRGTSDPIPAAEAAAPSPGYENTFSASTEPPNSSLKEPNCIVTAGSIIFLKP